MPRHSRTSDSATTIRSLADRAASDPDGLEDDEWVRLLQASGDELDIVTHTADDVRRSTVGDVVTMVVNRNVDSRTWQQDRSPEPGRLSPRLLEELSREAWDQGVTEICVRGVVPPTEDPASYPEILRSIRAGAPGMHLHAFTPQDLADFADRSRSSMTDALAQLQRAGLGSVPGTGTKILSERVRALIAPDDLEIDRWVDIITTAHRAGTRSTSTIFFGHFETAAERIGHLRTIGAIQDATGGFTEFIPIPFPAPGTAGLSGRSMLDDTRAMTAVSRLMLNARIPHLQVAWPRTGVSSIPALLRSGADDLGGVLMPGSFQPSDTLTLPFEEATRLTSAMLRQLRPRTTLYGEPRQAGQR